MNECLMTMQSENYISYWMLDNGTYIKSETTKINVFSSRNLLCPFLISLFFLLNHVSSNGGATISFWCTPTEGDGIFCCTNTFWSSWGAGSIYRSKQNNQCCASCFPSNTIKSNYTGRTFLFINALYTFYFTII